MATFSDPSSSSAHLSVPLSPPPPPPATTYYPPPPPPGHIPYPPPPPPPATNFHPPPPPPATNFFPPPPQYTIRPPPQHSFSNSPVSPLYQLEQPIPITIPVPLKLSHNNFLPWQAQILPLIHGHNLAKFLTSPPPNPTRQVTGGHIEFNYDYLIWNRQDQLLLGWLRASLSESVAAQVVSCTSSAALWSTLHQQFSSNSRARLVDLKRQLQSARRGSSSCIEFLQQIRSVADELSFIGAPPSDDDLILALLNGLGTEFNAFVAALTTTSRTEPLSFATVHGMLLSHEALLKGQLQISLPDSSAFLANHNNSAKLSSSQPRRSNGGNTSAQNGGTTGFRNPSSGKPNFPNPPPNNATVPQSSTGTSSTQPPKQCQICKKYGHIAKYCKWRYQPDPSHQQSQQQPQQQPPTLPPQAYVA